MNGQVMYYLCLFLVNLVVFVKYDSLFSLFIAIVCCAGVAYNFKKKGT